MKVISWAELTNDSCFAGQFEKGAAVTVGSFDGPHKGHYALFKKVLDFSKKNGTLSGIITFEKPVSSIKQGESYKGDISTLEKRLEIFNSLGFDFVLVIHFDKKFSLLEGSVFFQILKERLNLKFIAEGEDFCCGHNGSFSRMQIQEFCQKNNIEYSFIELVKEDGKRISSTMIRELIAGKHIDMAEKLLGY